VKARLWIRVMFVGSAVQRVVYSASQRSDNKLFISTINPLNWQLFV